MLRLAIATSLLLLASASPISPLAPQPPASPAPELASDYDLREVEGFRIHFNKRLITDDPAKLDRVLLHLRSDLDEIEHFVPAPALIMLRSVEFYIELQGTMATAHAGHGLCCHWSRAWLAEHNVLPDKAGHVEIINPEDFLNWRRDQPYMLFHEMAHALHWRLAELDPRIKETFDHAMKAKLYDSVPRNTIPQGQTVKSYAATNDHEYFAELSEAYFALNDFYPFTRPQLQAHDPEGFALMQKIWGLSKAEFASKWSPREKGVNRPAELLR